MNWLKDFFFCNTWGELVLAMSVARGGWVYCLLGSNLYVNYPIWIGRNT
jgi:hypothetical protein